MASRTSSERRSYTKDDGGCRWTNLSEARATLIICSEAEGAELLVTSSGQSGTLSTEASRRNSPITIETTFNHVDARVRAFTFLLS